MNPRFNVVLNTFLILGSLFFLFIGLVYGKTFLVPFVSAIILSMLMNPVATRLMKWGFGRVWAVLVSDFIVVIFISFMIFLLVAQANNVAQNWSQIQSQVQPKLEQIQKLYDEKVKTPISSFQNGASSAGQQGQQNESQQQGQQSDSLSQPQSGQTQQQQQTSQGQQQDSQQQNSKSNQDSLQPPSQQQDNQQQDQESQQFDTDKIRSMLTGIVSNIFSFLSEMLLMLVYIFFFMYYRRKFEDAIVGLVADDKKEQARQIIKDSSAIAQKYLLGRLILIAILAVLYAISFSIFGIDYAIFVALLAALFSLLPFIGNIIALGLALMMLFISGGETNQMIGIIIAFGIIQFVESYLLEPYIVGDKVDLNPVAIIVGVVLGGIVWGIMGMILVIPILGIIKVVFDSIPALRPLGYVLDERGIDDDDKESKTDKIKKWVKRKFKG